MYDEDAELDLYYENYVKERPIQPLLTALKGLPSGEEIGLDKNTLELYDELVDTLSTLAKNGRIHGHQAYRLYTKGLVFSKKMDMGPGWVLTSYTPAIYKALQAASVEMPKGPESGQRWVRKWVADAIDLHEKSGFADLSLTKFVSKMSPEKPKTYASTPDNRTAYKKKYPLPRTKKAARDQRRGDYDYNQEFRHERFNKKYGKGKKNNGR